MTENYEMVQPCSEVGTPADIPPLSPLVGIPAGFAEGPKHLLHPFNLFCLG